MKRCRLLLLAALFSFAKCNPDISHGPVEPSAPSQQLLSLEDLQDMISSLEERRRQLHSNTTSPAQRRLGMHSHSGAHSDLGMHLDSEMVDSETEELKPTQQATCSFDIIGITLAVARTGTVLYFVQDTCKNTETINQKSACAATINGLFATIGFLISFMSDSINACQTTLNIPATCSAVGGNLLAILGILGGSISSLENNCRAVTLANENPEWLQYVKEKPKWLKYVKRRLSGRSSERPTNAGVKQMHSTAKLPPLPVRSILSEAMIQEIRNNLSAAEFRRVEIAQCTFDTMLTAMFFGRGLLDIYNAAMHSPCTVADDFDHQLDQDATCMVQVSGMITTFDFVGALISLVVSECPEGANIKALCASDATILVGAVSGLLQTGASFLLVCGQESDEIDHILDDIGPDIVP